MDYDQQKEFCRNAFQSFNEEMARRTTIGMGSLVQQFRSEGVSDDIICAALMDFYAIGVLLEIPGASATAILNQIFGETLN